MKGIYDAFQQAQINKGMANNLDVCKYSDPKFSFEQMEQIRLGLEHGVDVNSYADVTLSSLKMKKIRRELEEKSE